MDEKLVETFCKETCVDAEWIHLARYMDQWRILMNLAINISVYKRRTDRPRDRELFRRALLRGLRR